MRLIVVALAAVLLTPSGASAARLRITTPSPAGFVAAAPSATSLAAEIVVRGDGRPGRSVEIRSGCVISVCGAFAVVNSSGRFKANLHVVLPYGYKHVRLDARYFRGRPKYTRTYALNLPRWAALAPYSPDKAVPLLAMFGDSLAEGTEDELRSALPDWKVTTDAVGGRPLAKGMDALGLTPLPFDRRLVLAFSLFTNDDPLHVDELEAAVRASLARIGPGANCVVWANIVRPKVRGVSYAAANARLLELAHEDPRLMIVDWVSAVRRHPHWMVKDGVHPTLAGYDARAELYANAARAC